MHIDAINGVRYLNQSGENNRGLPAVENNAGLDFGFLIQQFLNDLNAMAGLLASRIQPDKLSETGSNGCSNNYGGKNIDQNQLLSVIDQISERYGIDANLVKAVIKQESNFNPHAVSKAGALGMMQLMPATARELGVEDPMDPVENIKGGVKYLKTLIDRFRDVKKALAAYNAGPGFVEKNGADNYPYETKTYVNKVLMYKAQFDNKV